jgi:hypothetical protein
MHLFILDVDYRLCITWIIQQQLRGYKVEEELHLRVPKRLNTIGQVGYYWRFGCIDSLNLQVQKVGQSKHTSLCLLIHS